MRPLPSLILETGQSCNSIQRNTKVELTIEGRGILRTFILSDSSSFLVLCVMVKHADESSELRLVRTLLHHGWVGLSCFAACVHITGNDEQPLNCFVVERYDRWTSFKNILLRVWKVTLENGLFERTAISVDCDYYSREIRHRVLSGSFYLFLRHVVAKNYRLFLILASSILLSRPTR